MACETVDDLNRTLFQEESYDEYVSLTGTLADQVAEVEDPLLRDVATSLRIVALEWQGEDFAFGEFSQANEIGVDLLNTRCEELRG